MPLTIQSVPPIIRGHSPWGPIQTAREVAPGMVFVSTAGHGGLWLSPVCWATLKATLPYTPRYAPEPWLEEDCDCLIATLAFPELFPIEHLRAAVQCFGPGSDYQKPLRDWLKDSPRGRELVAMAGGAK